jgi:hypothetical protein
MLKVGVPDGTSTAKFPVPAELIVLGGAVVIDDPNPLTLMVRFVTAAELSFRIEPEIVGIHSPLMNRMVRGLIHIAVNPLTS